MSKRDCYEILGISQSASAAEIKKAFRSISFQLHPDHGGDAKKFAELKEAFEQALSRTKLQTLHDRVSGARQYPPERAHDNFTSKFYPSFIKNPTIDEIFADGLYDQRRFFEPSHPNIEGLERAERARAMHCSLCGDTGRVKKVLDPKLGFMSLETRLCKCQRI